MGLRFRAGHIGTELNKLTDDFDLICTANQKSHTNHYESITWRTLMGSGVCIRLRVPAHFHTNAALQKLL
jgi:hypothetical protein